MIGTIKLFFLSLLQGSMIFKPTASNIEEIKNPDEYGLSETVNVSLKTKDGEVINIWVRQSNQEDEEIFVFFHGNTGHLGDVGKPKKNEEYDRGYRVKLLRELSSRGYGFVAVSHRGYGKSSGKPSEAGFLMDIRSIAEFLEKEEYKNINIIGESLGCFSASALMKELTNNSNLNIKTLNLIAPFASMHEKVVELHPDLKTKDINSYLDHQLNSADILKTTNFKGKINLFHSKEDLTSNFFHSESIFKQAKEAGRDIYLYDISPSGHITWNPSKIVSIIEGGVKKE